MSNENMREGFNPYFESLQEQDLRQMIDEEDYNRKKFSYKCLDSDALEHLEDK